MSKYVLHSENSLEPIVEGSYRECQKRRTELNHVDYFGEKPVFVIEKYEAWKERDDAERVRVEAVLDREEAESQAYYAEHGKSEPVRVDLPQLDLFSEMGLALFPGDIVRSHGKELSFDDLLKMEGRYIVLDAGGILTVCRVDMILREVNPAFENGRRRLCIQLDDGTRRKVHLLRGDMKGSRPRRVYEL